MAEKLGSVSKPSADFASGAAAGLAPVASDLREVRKQAEQGSLRLDDESARALLVSLAEIQARVQHLIQRGSEDIDVRLKLGDNYVGQVMSDRLQGAASGGTRAAMPVLEEFGRLLRELAATIDRAKYLHTTNDEDAAEQINTALRRTGHDRGDDQRNGAV